MGYFFLCVAPLNNMTEANDRDTRIIYSSIGSEQTSLTCTHFVKQHNTTVVLLRIASHRCLSCTDGRTNDNNISPADG